MGFPLHRGSVESGLVTCHWHNARFDLRSGGTLDPWADDVRAYPVEIDDGRVVVVVTPEADRGRAPPGPPRGRARAGHLPRHGQGGAGAARRRGPTGGDRADGRRLRHPLPGSRLGCRADGADGDGQRPAAPRPGRPGAGAGGRAGLRVPRHPRSTAPLPVAAAGRQAAGGEASPGTGPTVDQLAAWYRRFIETRSSDAAERTLATVIVATPSPAEGVASAADRDVRRRNRSRLPRRRAHDRLHEQGVRGARPRRAGRRAPRSCRRSSRRPPPRPGPRRAVPGAIPTTWPRLIADATARLPERMAAGSACAVRFDEAAADDDSGRAAWLAAGRSCPTIRSRS